MQNTEIHRYYQNGTLEMERTRWQAIDRFKAAEILQQTAFKAGIYITASDPSKIKVDISGYKPVPEHELIAQDMYKNAYKSIPSEYWPVVRHVVVEDKKIQYPSRAEVHLAKWRLCLGLDYLCDFYARQMRWK